MNDKDIYGEGGGGGCFPAGTKVNTPQGYRNIEDIKVGDTIYAYDISTIEPEEYNLPGVVSEKEVINTFIHLFGEVGYTSKLLKIKHTDGTLVVTGNHYILTPSRQSVDADPMFARADELQVGDILYTEYGAEVVIEEIIAGDEYDFVYNLEVADLHTYVASKIRVHNGGGGKGDSPRAAVQAPNTVRTRQVARVLNLVSEGETYGPWNQADPAQSIFFDNTPLKNADGSYNYTNIGLDTRVGLPSQTVMEGFSAIEGETLVNQVCTTITPITKSLASTVDAVRVTVQFNAGLQSISATNGDANGTSVQFRISRRTSGGIWSAYVTPTITEMSSGPFEVAYRIPKIGTSTWEFKLERITADSTSNYLINAISLKSYTEIQEVTLPYNDRAMYALVVGADSTNNTIPPMAADWGGILCSIPDNYNPTTRVYTGSWGGTFASTKRWLDNPAWLLLELIRAPRFGLGTYISDNQIDMFSFYNAAKYCDELVNDGKGTGTYEPRFTFNAQLMVREDAWKTLQAIASSFRSMLYVHNGYIRLSQDRPTTATRLITNSNTINGLFTYSATESRTRYTACNVTYSDITDNCLPKTITEKGSSGDITRYGYTTTEIVSYGATTEGQARRDARWVVDTSVSNTDICEFIVGPQFADFEPGEVFKVMDTDYAQESQEGRFISVVGSTLTLDKPVTITTGTWTIDSVSSDGSTIETRTITTGAGTTSTITISGTITGTAGTVYIITGAVSPRQFRCISMVESDNLQYKIKAIQYDPNKYTRIETGVTIPSPVYWSQPKLASVATPTNLVITPQTSTTPDGIIHRYLNITWTAPADNSAASYRISWRRGSGYLETITSVIPFARISADVSGTYDFYVNAINNTGVTSPTLNGSYTLNLDIGTDSGIGTPTALQLVDGGTSFGSGTMSVQWNAPADVYGYTLKDYEITLQVPSGAIFKTFYSTNRYFNYSYDDNVSDGGPRNAIQVNVRARDTYNKTGSPATNTFTASGAPSVTGLQVRGGGTVFSTLDLEIEWTCTNGVGTDFKNDPNFAFFKVEVYNGATLKRTEQVTDSTYIYSYNNNIKDNGIDTPSNSIIIKVTAYNTMSVPSGTATTTFTPIAPPTPTSLWVVGTSGVIFNTNDLEMDWVCQNANSTDFKSSNLFKNFKVEFYNGAVLKRTDTTLNASYVYDYFKNQADNGVTALRTPGVKVYAVSVYNVLSTAASSTFSNPAPSAPVVTTSPGVDMIFIDAVRQAADPDVVGYEYHISTTPAFTPSGSVAGTGTCVYTGPNSSITYKVTGGITYYVRVAAYDGFGVSGLNYSIQTSGAVSTPVVGTDYEFLDFYYTPNSPTANKVAWTTGTVSKRAGATGVGSSWVVTASNATWTSGTLYIYWDETAPTVFSSTTTLATATGDTKRIVALYKGGMDVKSADGKVLVDGTTTIFPGTINSTLLVTGSAVITGEAQMGTATVNAAAIKNAVITNAKIVDLTVNSVKLANGCISDTRFLVSNSATTLVSNSAVGTYTISPIVVAELAITTPNPSGLLGPFPTYIHAQLVTNTKVNGLINYGAYGGIGVTTSNSLNIQGSPSWQIRVIRVSDSVIVASSDTLNNNGGIKVGNIDTAAYGGVNLTITNNINIVAAGGTNLVFLAPNLAANTAYKIQIVASGQLLINNNTGGNTISITADQRAIYYQCLLR